MGDGDGDGDGLVGMGMDPIEARHQLEQWRHCRGSAQSSHHVQCNNSTYKDYDRKLSPVLALSHHKQLLHMHMAVLHTIVHRSLDNYSSPFPF